MGISLAFCKTHDIDPSKEVNLGSGPVDFKFSKGYQERALIEAKLAKNTKFWNGLTAQLPQYLKTEEIKDGVYLVIIYSLADVKRVNSIRDSLQEVNKDNKTRIRVISVDARRRPSASKLPSPYTRS